MFLSNSARKRLNIVPKIWNNANFKDKYIHHRADNTIQSLFFLQQFVYCAPVKGLMIHLGDSYDDSYY